MSGRGLAARDRQIIDENAAKYRQADRTYVDPVKLDGVGILGHLVRVRDLAEEGFPWHE